MPAFLPAFLPGLSPYLMPIALLVGSNLFMTAAWYWHLKYKEVPLISVIFISWALAFVEYCLAVPANRFGSSVYSAAQLKTIQEVITLVIFVLFSSFYLKEALTWSQGFGFVLIAAGAFFVFHKL
ncbi:MAG TPA: DMT family protein [Rhizomicrobium sp.]